MRLFLLHIVCLASFANAQVTFVASDSIVGKYDHFSVDNLGRIYTVQSDVLVQFSANLDTLFTASLKSFRPSSIESTKSFRTLLFDDERSLIKFLDNTLTDHHEDIDLINLDIQQPLLVCESFVGNGFWVLDVASSRLVKIDQNFNQILVTENVLSFIQNQSKSADLPIQMKESNDYLFIAVPKLGVLIFDAFGTYVNTYPTQPKRINCFGQHLMVLNDSNQLEIIPITQWLEPNFVYDVPADVIDFYYSNSKVYFLRPGGVYIGAFKKPQK